MYLDEEEKKRLLSLGWTEELIEHLKPTPQKDAVSKMFLDRAKKALADAGYSALDLLAEHSSLSILELAKKINRGANAFGLKLAIYEEADEKGIVREVAKDMLIRQINDEYPNGWIQNDEIRPAVRVGSWGSDISDGILNPQIAKAVKSILRHLTIDSPPPEGWKPQRENDPLIDGVFNHYWPCSS